MKKSREYGINLCLQLICIYLVTVALSVPFKLNTALNIMNTALFILPLNVFLFVMRRKYRIFFTNIIITMISSLVYSLVMMVLMGNKLTVAIAVVVIFLYSISVAYRRTSLNDAEHISFWFIAVLIVTYSLAMHFKAQELKNVAGLTFLIFVLLQLIYNYVSKMGVVFDLDGVLKIPKRQILLVTKTLAGMLCFASVVIFLIVQSFSGNIFGQFKIDLSFMNISFETHSKTEGSRENGKLEDRTTEKETEESSEEIPTIETEEVQKRNSNSGWEYIVVVALLVAGTIVFVCYLFKWFKKLRKDYAFDNDEFSSIDDADMEDTDEEVIRKKPEKMILKQRRISMEINEYIKLIKENVAKVIVGKEEVTDSVLVALLSEGHILLEDVPGTGKTMLAKTFAKSIGADFTRIQFTADLLPTDVTGLNFYNQKESEFTFKKGPIFSNLILADEINRATPKTQSALIECMEEHQVTVDGKTTALESPFLVIATENPIENVGTFPLPEAQLDRFLLKVHMGYPDVDDELEIIDKFFEGSPIENISNVCSRENVIEMIKEARAVVVDDNIRKLIVNIIQETRNSNDIEIGASPRASLALMRAIRSYAYIAGRKECIVEDVKAMAVPVLAHRIRLKPMNLVGTKTSEEIVREIVWNLC